MSRCSRFYTKGCLYIPSGVKVFVVEYCGLQNPLNVISEALELATPFFVKHPDFPIKASAYTLKGDPLALPF